MENLAKGVKIMNFENPNEDQKHENSFSS